MNKIKVAHFLNTGGYSGAEKVVVQIINKMRDTCEFVYVSPTGIIDEILFDYGIKHYILKERSFGKIKDAIKNLNPDIIHVHDYNMSVLVGIVEKKIPIISHLHNNPPWIKKINLKTISYSLVCKRFAEVFAVSDAIIDEFVFSKSLEGKSNVIGNPIDVEGIRAEMPPLFLEKKYDVAFFGRLSQAKNPICFLDIIDELKKRMPDIHAVMIGDGELRGKVENTIKNRMLEKNIQLVGFLKEPYSELIKSKIVCMPSVWEGFGLAAVEALSLGIPVVCSDVGGLPNLVNSSCGSVCSTKEQMIDSIYLLLTDQLKLQDLSEGAKTQTDILDNYSLYMNDMKRKYLILCERKKT